MSFIGKRGENGVVVMLKAEAMEKAFKPYADGINDIKLFETGFNAGVEWLTAQMCKSLELGFKETIDKMVIRADEL